MPPATTTATSDSAAETQLPETIEELPFDFSETPLRHEVEGGEDYLAAPVTAQLEGVYAYPNDGPGPPGITKELLPGEELTANVSQWEGQPLVLRHPRKGGDLVTTEAPGADVTEVGEFRRATEHSTDDALRGEAWIRANELGRHGGDLTTYVRDVASGSYGEVSTGYIPRIEDESGTHDGQRYNAVQRDLQPDHLALLPDDVGNCSVEQGCGFGRFNARLRANVRKPVSDDHHATMSDSTRDDSIAGADAAGPETDPIPERPLAQMRVRANARDTVRDPSYTDTDAASGDWERPPLDAYVEAAHDRRRDGEQDDLPSTVSELPADIKQWISARSLLGDSEADSYDELLKFPVVAPNNELSEDALDAVLSTVGSADLSDDLQESVREKARSLLESEFDREFDDRENSSAETGPDGDPLRSNIRSEARVPEYETTVSRLEEEVEDGPSGGPWSLGDFYRAWVEQNDVQAPADPYSPLDSIEEAAREWIAQHSLLGSPEAESGENLLMFAVVSPDGELYETRLADVLGGAGGRATIPAEQRRSARSVARDLLEDEFAWSFDETEGESRTNADGEPPAIDGDEGTRTTEDLGVDPDALDDAGQGRLAKIVDTLYAALHGDSRANAAPAEEDGDDAEAADRQGETQDQAEPAEGEADSDSESESESEGEQIETVPAESGTGDAEADAEESGGTASDAAASDAANAPTAADSDSQSMSNRTQELVEEHGFDAENLPDEGEQCFDRIYEKFAGSADGEAQAGEQTDTEVPEAQADSEADAEAQTETETETETVDGSVDAETQTAPDAGAEAEADEEVVTANLNELKEEVKEEVKEEINGPSEDEVERVNSKLRSNAGWSDEEIEQTPFSARKKAAERLGNDDETRASEQAIGGQESSRSNFAGVPREARSNVGETTEDVSPPAAGYAERLNSQGGDN